jgi:hypothetical protein
MTHTESEQQMGLPDFLDGLPGADHLDNGFCNKAVRVDQIWEDEPMAVVYLCGRLTGHRGDCDPTPPLSDINPALNNHPDQEPCVTGWSGRMVTSFCDQCGHGLLTHLEDRRCELCRIISIAQLAS